MVYYNPTALDDLDDIFEGLLQWQTTSGQAHMSYEQIVQYHNDIRRQCESLPMLSYHHPTRYYDHIKYGSFVHTYKRSRRTLWYIIYEKFGSNFYVCKIMNNYVTKE